MSLLDGFLGSAACAGLSWLCRRSQPQVNGVLHVPGLSAPVEIIRDRWGVPHIYGQNAPDVMLAQGFAQAQDRLWQMEFQRRLVSGRLAEVLGPRALPVDRWLRVLGIRYVAEQEEALLAPDVRAELEAFAAGVNAQMAVGPLPIEFTLLHHRPEPWSVADTIAWSLMVCWSLSVNWEAELLRAQLIARLGPEREAELEPDYCSRWPCVVPRGMDYGAIGRQAQERVERARALAGRPAHDGLGSNDWVLAGSRTASGAPLVANDLHQQMSIPCLWYENHLVGGGLDVTGVTFAGAFGVLSGHNAHVAWGFSNGFPDVQDLYAERLRLAPGGRVQYQHRGEWHHAKLRREVIRVRGKGIAVEDVISTHHGPIINALAPDAAGEQPLALRWTCFEPGTMAQLLHSIDRVESCLDLRETLRHWTGPSQNIVYADTAGNIGYTFPGRVPIRPKGEGRVPVPGWTGEYEWAGYVPFEELPHLYNPPQGYVASANNRAVADDYRYHISCDYCSGDRAQRIIEMIEARARVDIDYACAMQLDQRSPGARLVAGYIARLPVEDPELAPVVEIMRRWDGHMSVDSPAAAVHEALIPRLAALILSGTLEDLTGRYTGRGPVPVVADASLFGFRAWEWLQATLPDPGSHWFDLGHGETRDDVLRLALRQTVDHLRAELGPDPQSWAWGRVHSLTYSHLLGQVKPLDRLFNRGPYPLGGNFTTVCATGAPPGPDGNGQAVIGPSYRYVVDMSDLRHGRSQLVPGQSGRPGSPHYDDQVRPWFSGEYHPMLFAREDVEREAESRLLLVPD
ncbi:MAG TPA: penicillin acylase family protein [Anaerolineae bacterium]|nr:penicillin acylase family protein [Anaerolineae bacterium]HOQ97214.1 penicillin acylase family protein [Anaerolineae bacterium]HPL26440.1 penicillin acylase family protein [Anaerolineae bacterium]